MGKKYRGVSQRNGRKAYDVILRETYRGSFKTAEAGANCYNYWAIIELPLEKRMLNDVIFMPKEEWEKERSNSRRILKKDIREREILDKKYYSKHMGITYDKTAHNLKWVARLKSKGKVVYQKCFASEEEAVEALETVKAELGIKVIKKSKYRGVSYAKKEKLWIANITYKKINYYLGGYITEEEAGLAYNKKAKELLGESARLNGI